jgi:hypothetical protein
VIFKNKESFIKQTYMLYAFPYVAHYTCSFASAAERSNVELDTPITLLHHSKETRKESDPKMFSPQ